MIEDLRVAWFRFHATFRRTWRSYLALAMLIGLVGGLALGSIAAARRTATSFAVYLKSTNPSDLNVEIIPTNGSGYESAALTKQIAHLPHVEAVAGASLGLTPYLVGANDLPSGTAAEQSAFDGTQVIAVGSISGLYFGQDRVTVVDGVMADPGNPHQFVTTPAAASLLGWHLGERFRIGLFTAEQIKSVTSGGPVRVKAPRVLEESLVGLVQFNDAIVHDDVNRYPTDILLTPASTKQFLASQGPSLPVYGLKLDGGSRFIPQVEKELNALVPRFLLESPLKTSALLEFQQTSIVTAEAARTVEPQALALGVFGGIAAVAAMLIAAQAIVRRIRERDEELVVLRALGSGSMMTTIDGLIGVVGSIVVGAVVALFVGFALSPLAPIGPVRQVYPSKGLNADWVVFGIGFDALVLGLSTIALLTAYRGAPHRISRDRGRDRYSVLIRTVSGRLSPATTAGLRFALDPGRGRAAVPARSVVLATVLAVAMAVASLTFGDGLSSLVSTPALYGWNWSYAIEASGGYGDVPLNYVQKELETDPYFVSASGVAFLTAALNGVTVPILFGEANAPVAPPILSGHGLDAANEIVLGSATLAALHKSIGDTVTLTYGVPSDAPAYLSPTTLRIVGTATLPAIGTPQGLHVSMGTGALAPYNLMPSAVTSCSGPSSDVLVRLKPDASPQAELASMRAVTRELGGAFARLSTKDPCTGESIELLGVEHPAEIVNYRSMGDTPAILASAVAAGAAIALGLTLAASVRRRRRELAVLKTLGFTQRQLAATVAWQSSFISIIGAVVGIPLGVALGRWLWILFAHQIDAVPEPSVPALAIALVGIGAVVFANLIAAIPGRIAGKTPIALALRAE